MAGQAGISWFPQEFASEFHMVKGLLALYATVLLLHHMNRIWSRLIRDSTIGQRLRYLTLLAFAVLTAGGSAEQVGQDAEVNYRNLGGLTVIMLLIVAVSVSLYEDRDRER